MKTLVLDLLVKKSSGQSNSTRKENSESNRVTLMVILMSLLFFFGNVLDALSGLLPLIGVDLYSEFSGYLIISNTFLFLEHGLTIFIFYNCNKCYKRTFRKMFRLRATENSEESTRSKSISKSANSKPTTKVDLNRMSIC